MPDDPIQTNFYISVDSTSAVLLVDRDKYRLTLQNCTYGIQGIPSLEFTEECAASPLHSDDPYHQTDSLQGNFRSGQWVVVELEDLTTHETNVIFLGQIVSNSVGNLSAGCVNVGYKAIGMRKWANEIYTSNSDYSGRVQYNMNPLDAQFVWDLSGFTLGDCIYAYLQLHRAALEFYNITIPTNPAADIDSELAQGSFTQVPQDPIVLQGRILDAIDGIVSQYAPKMAMFLDSSVWTVDVPETKLRFVDTTNLPPTTLTLNQDPIKVQGLSGDTTNSFTCTILRGAGDIDGAYLKWNPTISAYGLVPSADWNVGAWNWDKFANPPNSSNGTITAVASTEQIVIHPTSGLTSWSRNLDGTWAVVVDGVAQTWPSTGGNNIFTEYACWVIFGFSTTLPPPYPGGASGTASANFGTMYEITDSTECPAGVATITLSPPLSQGWSGNLTYQIRPGPLNVDPTYRKFDIPTTIDGVPNRIAYHLVKHFANGRGYPWSPVPGTIQITAVPLSQVAFTSPGPPPSTISGPASFQIVQSQDGVLPGFILFDTPIVSTFNQLADLRAGIVTNVPTEVYAIVPYSKSALEAYYPAPTGNPRTTGSFNFSGTSFTKYGIKRYYYKDYYTWVSNAQSNTMNELARQIAETIQDEVIDSTINYYGCRFDLMKLGQSLNIATASGTTGFEAMNCPVRTITITWPENEGSQQVVSFHINNQRKPFQGDRHYLHPLWRRDSPMMDTMTRAASLNTGMIQGANMLKQQIAMQDETNGIGASKDMVANALMATSDPTYIERQQRQNANQAWADNTKFAKQLSQPQSLKQVREQERAAAKQFAGPTLAETRQREAEMEARFKGPSLKDVRAADGPSGYKKPAEREAARKRYADRLETHRTGDRMMAQHKHEDEAKKRREASQENRGLPGASMEGGESAARARQQEHIQSREAQGRRDTREATKRHEQKRQAAPGFHERRDAASLREFPDRTRERGPGRQPQGYDFKYQAMPANPFMPGRSVSEGAGQAPLPGSNPFMPGRSVAEGAGQNPLPGGNVFMPGEPGQTQGSANPMPNYLAHQQANAEKHAANIAEGKASVASQQAIQAQKKDKLWWARRNKQAPMVPGFGPVDKGGQ